MRAVGLGAEGVTGDPLAINWAPEHCRSRQRPI